MSETITPSRFVALLLLMFVALWTLLPGLLHTALPLDVVESGAWGREHVLMSFKHPNLPGLLIEAGYLLTGQYGWPQYLLSAAWTALAIWLVYLLGRRMFGGWAGAAGAALLVGCYYFTWPVPELNHNIAQLPVWAGVALLLWLSVDENRPWQWVALGLVAGIGLFAKLSVLTVVAAGGVWMLADAKARARLAGYWPWLGLLVFVIIAAGFAWQLAGSGGGPIAFLEKSGSNGTGPVHFVVAQLLDITPLLIVVGVAVGLPRPRTETVVAATADLARIRIFLGVVMGLPLLTGTVTAAVLGAQTMWGAPMLNLVGLAILAALPVRFDWVAIRRIRIGVLVLVLLMPGLFGARYLITSHTAENPLRTQWPQAAIAAHFAGLYEQQAKAPLTIVGGDDWLAGLVALGIEPRGSVYHQLDRTAAPWITPERVASEGMLVLWRGGSRPPSYAEPLLDGHRHGVEQFVWSDNPEAKPVEIGYLIVPPRPIR